MLRLRTPPADNPAAAALVMLTELAMCLLRLMRVLINLSRLPFRILVMYRTLLVCILKATRLMIVWLQVLQIARLCIDRIMLLGVVILPLMMRSILWLITSEVNLALDVLGEIDLVIIPLCWTIATMLVVLWIL